MLSLRYKEFIVLVKLRDAKDIEKCIENTLEMLLNKYNKVSLHEIYSFLKMLFNAYNASSIEIVLNKAKSTIISLKAENTVQVKKAKNGIIYIIKAENTLPFCPVKTSPHNHS
jgi:hypothetical protein